MVVEFTRLPIAPEGAKAFEIDWVKAAAILVRQPGYSSHRLGKVVEQADHYVLEIEWASLEAHTKQFVNNPSFQAFLGFIKPHLAGEAHVIHFEVTQG